MLALRYYLWIAPHILLALLLALLLYRNLQRRLPVFVAYLIFDLGQFLASVIIRLQSPYPKDVYHWMLVFVNGINALLELGVIYELANQLLFNRSSLAPIFRLILRGSLAALVLAAAIASGALSEIGLERVTNVFEAVDFSSNLVLAGMLLTLFLLSRALRISWRNWAVGVALGFGVSACIDLASAALRAGFGRDSLILVDVTQMAAFHVAAVIWLIYVLRADDVSSPVSPLHRSDLELWDQEMRGLVQR